MADEVYTLTPEFARELVALVRDWRARQNRLRVGAPALFPRCRPIADGGILFRNWEPEEATAYPVLPHETICLGFPPQWIGEGNPEADPDEWQWDARWHDDSTDTAWRAHATWSWWITPGAMLAVNGPDRVEPGECGRAYMPLAQPCWARYTLDEYWDRPPRIGEPWGPGTRDEEANTRLAFGFPGFRAVGPIDEDRQLVRVIADTVGPWWCRVDHSWAYTRDERPDFEWREANGMLCRGPGAPLIWNTMSTQFSLWLPPGRTAADEDIVPWTFGFVPQRLDGGALGGHNALTPVALGCGAARIPEAGVWPQSELTPDGAAKASVSWRLDGTDHTVALRAHGRLPDGTRIGPLSALRVIRSPGREEVDGQELPRYEAASVGADYGGLYGPRNVVGIDADSSPAITEPWPEPPRRWLIVRTRHDVRGYDPSELEPEELERDLPECDCQGPG